MRKVHIVCIGTPSTLFQTLTSRFETHYSLFFTDALQVAENYLQTLHPGSEIILLNVDMPNGFGILKQLKETYLTSDVLVLSDKDTDEKVMMSLKMGALCYIKQPHLFSEIEEGIKEAAHSKLSQKITHYTTRHFMAHFALQQQLLLTYHYLTKTHQRGGAITVDDLMSVGYSEQVCQRYFSRKEFKIILEDSLSSLTLGSKLATLMIVDSLGHISEDIYEQLEESYHLICTSNKESALDLSKTEPCLDVLIVDEDSLALIGSFLRVYPDVLVIVISDTVSVETLNVAFRKGGSDFLIHPTQECLFQAMEQLLETRFLKKFLPLFSQKYVSETLDPHSKSALLEELCADKQSQGEAFQMSDIYTFFPELKQTHIPAEVTLPDTVIQEGITHFVQKMMETLPQCVMEC